jgi:hypothetical protein
MIVEGVVSECCHGVVERGYFASGVYCDKCMECYDEFYVGTGSVTHEQIAADIAHRELVSLALEALEFVRELRRCLPDEAVDLLTNTDKFDEDEVKDDHTEGNSDSQ